MQNLGAMKKKKVVWEGILSRFIDRWLSFSKLIFCTCLRACTALSCPVLPDRSAWVNTWLLFSDVELWAKCQTLIFSTCLHVRTTTVRSQGVLVWAKGSHQIPPQGLEIVGRIAPKNVSILKLKILFAWIVSYWLFPLSTIEG